ncbi:hypothetical protein A6E01_19995 (plasmid) [Vibrio breoganii]|uniref:Uncharacterized protein n=1 Tax=Vibrio breoganii TaxID=553239 RepID=A0AAN1CUF9_9VIBR|nr:hypothetical protein [Vibrio breoganii]ANO35497.1 hypothetical protein A6E01_19995 [Vibrio breoganii]
MITSKNLDKLATKVAVSAFLIALIAFIIGTIGARIWTVEIAKVGLLTGLFSITAGVSFRVLASLAITGLKTKEDTINRASEKRSAV